MRFNGAVVVVALAVIPLAAVLAGYALRPRIPVVAPLRLAAARAALAVAGYAVVVVEVAGAARALTAPVVALAWVAGLLAAAGAAAWRHARDGAPPSLPRPRLPFTSLPERLLGAALGALVLAELLVAAVAAPNNYDSQTYHLPRIEHWVDAGGVGMFATPIHRQVTLAPGAEYLLTHLRLLTGGDALYNLVQWAAGVGCLLVASRIAAQLGGGRRAQLLTAFVVGSTPMVALQASSTQNDLVVAAWTGCVATLVLDGLRRRARPADVLALGVATGLTALTKNTGLLAAGPLLLLWAAGQLVPPPAAARPAPPVWRAVPRVAVAGLGVLVVAAALVGPFLGRVTAEFGGPLGPPQLTGSIPMQRHDPAAIVVNGARIAHTALDTPLAPLRDGAARAVIGLARVLHVDPRDPLITFPHQAFPVPAWYPDEDRAAFPIPGVLAITATALALARPVRLGARRLRLRGYAAVVVTSVLLYAATVKWQPWGNRLLMYALVLAAPLVGLWLDGILRRRGLDGVLRRRAGHHAVRGAPSGAAATPAGPGRSRAAVAAVAVVLAAAAVAGALSVGYGYPRRLVGAGSVLTTGDWELRFLRRPHWAAQYAWAADRVAGARRIGLVESNDDWEYPWWLLLRRHQDLVELRSVVPGHPPAAPASVDAIVCTAAPSVCARIVPSGWRIDRRGDVTVALPPVP